MFLLLFNKGDIIMHQEFSILTIEPILVDKKIVVHTNMDIDKESVHDIFVEIFERDTKAPLSLTKEIKGCDLEINLTDWPIPNSIYIVGVKNIKNVLGEEVKANLRRKISFESSVVKEVEILSPAMHETINSLDIKFKTINPSGIDDKSIKNEYVYLEVSDDVAFHNISTSTKVYGKDNITLSLDTNNQFFIRARVQNEDNGLQYGKWSEVISFVYGHKPTTEAVDKKPGYVPGYEDLVDDMLPEIDDVAEFKLSLITPQATTPKSFLFKSTKHIDELSFESSNVFVYNTYGPIEHSVKAYEDTIEIILLEELEHNTDYDIKLLNIESEFGDVETFEFRFVTKMTPLYCSIFDVTALVGNFQIEQAVIVHHIHEASKFADYIVSSCDYPFVIEENNVPFPVKQFVKYYAAHECLLRHLVDITSSVGLSGVVGNVQFSERESSKDATKLLEHFCRKIKEWEDALKGYELEGRARLKTAVRGRYASPQFEALQFDKYQSFGRGDLYGR